MTVGAARLSRALAIALTAAAAAAACLVVWSFLGAPLANGAARINALKKEVAFLQASKARLGEAARWSEARERAQATKRDFLQEPTPALAAATLQAAMRRAAQDSGLEIISAQDAVIEEKAQKGVSIRMALSGDFSQLTTFLATLSEMTPVVLVDEIDVRAQANDREEDSLNISVTGASYLWRESGAS